MHEMNYLEDKIGAEYNILIKVHPFLYSTAVKSEELKGKLVPDFVDTNQLLSTIAIVLNSWFVSTKSGTSFPLSSSDLTAVLYKKGWTFIRILYSAPILSSR